MVVKNIVELLPELYDLFPARSLALGSLGMVWRGVVAVASQAKNVLAFADPFSVCLCHVGFKKGCRKQEEARAWRYYMDCFVHSLRRQARRCVTHFGTGVFCFMSRKKMMTAYVPRSVAFTAAK